MATEAVAAIKVVTAYSLQPQVAELYHQAAAEGSGSRSAHFSGLAFGIAQVRGEFALSNARQLMPGLHHMHLHCASLPPPLPCMQLILFLFYCLMFWFGGTQIQAGSISFTQMNKVRFWTFCRGLQCCAACLLTHLLCLPRLPAC